MIKSHKIRLNPTQEQSDYFYKASGVARFTYNWGLAKWNELYEAGEKPSIFAIKKEFNAIKKEKFPWVYEVTKTACGGAFMDLGKAFSNFFDKHKKGALPQLKEGQKPRKDGKPLGYPRFKKKNKATPSFYIDNDKFTVDGHNIRIPKLGWVDMTESLRFNGKIKIMSARVSYKAGWWWVSIAVEVNYQPEIKGDRIVGLDLGIKTLIVASDGEVFENQKHLKSRLGKVKSLQKALSRKVKGSSNYKKCLRKLQKAHYKVECARKDAIHKATTYLSKTYGIIGLEDLNVLGMLKNHKLAQAVSDASFGEIVRQLEYKVEWFGGKVVYVDSFFPSSKLCNVCGWKNVDLTLSDRVWLCEGCGQKVDRDLNAALNIRDEALRILAN